MKKIIILGSSGSIGSYLSKKLSTNFQVVATTRNTSHSQNENNINYLSVDFGNREDIENFLDQLNNHKDIYGIINCYGIQTPIGKFREVDFKVWEENITINFNNFAFFLHKFLKSTTTIKKIIVCSGGGATYPRKYFSAYGISKIALYKYIEILSQELESDGIDLNLIAPGVIKSKMTQEVVDFGSILGDEYKNSLETLSDGGQDKEKIFHLCNFLLSEKSNGLSGRLISAQWDDIEDSDLAKLIKDKNLFTIRRIDQKYFMEKNKK